MPRLAVGRLADPVDPGSGATLVASPKHKRQAGRSLGPIAGVRQAPATRVNYSRRTTRSGRDQFATPAFQKFLGRYKIEPRRPRNRIAERLVEPSTCSEGPVGLRTAGASPAGRVRHFDQGRGVSRVPGARVDLPPAASPGAAVGDALGGATEGWTPPQIQERYGGSVTGIVAAVPRTTGRRTGRSRRTTRVTATSPTTR